MVIDGAQSPLVEGSYPLTPGPSVVRSTPADHDLHYDLQAGSNLRCSRDVVDSAPSASIDGVLSSSGTSRSTIAHDRVKHSASLGIRMLSLLFTYGVLFCATQASGAPPSFFVDKEHITQFASFINLNCSSRWEDFRGKIGTWNSRANLGDMALWNARVAKIKSKAREFVLSASDVLCMQETHALEGVESFLRTKHPDHIFFSSAGVERNQGGLIIAVKAAWIKGCVGWFHSVLSPGRLMMSILVCQKYVIQIFNIHIPPQWSRHDKLQLIRQMGDYIFSEQSTLVFIVGDLNFGDTRADGITDDHRFINDPQQNSIREFFEQMFHNFTEISQGEATHLGHSTLSRLDHIYARARLLTILDIQPTTRLLWNATSGLARASDHFPLIGSFLPRCADKGNSLPRIPKWVPSDPSFHDRCVRLFEVYRPYSNDPFYLLEHCRQIFHMVAKELKSNPVPNSAVSINHQIYWTMVAYRNLHNPFGKQFGNAKVAYPCLVELSVNESTAAGSIHAHLEGLMIQRTNAMLENEENPPEVRNQLSLWLSFWAAKAKKFSNIVIRKPCGELCQDLEEGALTLCNYWRDIFKDPRTRTVLCSNSLLPFVIMFPEIEWELGFDEFYQIIEHLRDSGTGPDHIFYSYWRLAPEFMIRMLFAVYQALIRGSEPEPSFNFSYLGFLPKGDEDYDAASQIREPSCTRPLNLSNTCNKIIAHALACPLIRVAPDIIHKIQKGGVRGRQMVDELYDIECKALKFMIARFPNSGLVGFDFRAAFPSLARKYLFWVLKAMNVPRKLRKAIFALYLNCYCFISLGGQSFSGFHQFCGVKQGCPLSMILFAIAIDPLIRFMNSRLDPISDRLGGYCDDLSLASANLRKALFAVAPAFFIAAKELNLHLNRKKIQCMLTLESEQEAFVQFIAENLGIFDGLRMVRALLLLGVYIGPEAFKFQWKRAVQNMDKACHKIVSLNVGAAASIPLYNSLCFSCGAWLASLVCPSNEVLALEYKLRQKLLKAPWQAIPSRLLANLKKSAGFPFQVADLTLAGIAGRARNALVTSSSYRPASVELQSALHEDERVLSILEQDWLHQSMLYSATNAIQYVTQHAPHMLADFRNADHPQKFKLQSKLCAELHEFQPFLTFEEVLSRRIRAFAPHHIYSAQGFPNMIKRVGISFRALATKIKPCVAFAFLKWLTSAICTTARFQQNVDECHLCATFSGDHIDHLIQCPIFSEFANRFWGHPFQLTRLSLCALSCDGLAIEGDILKIYAIHMYSALLLYNSTRTGHDCKYAFYHSSIVQLTGDCKESRRIVRLYRNSNRDEVRALIGG